MSKFTFNAFTGNFDRVVSDVSDIDNDLNFQTDTDVATSITAGTDNSFVSAQLAANILTLTRNDATTETIDLNLYLDDTNAAFITGGTISAAGIFTFTRDDATTFDVDASRLIDTAAINVVQANLDDHEADLANPHQVTATQVGLGNVDNTSDALKPLSSAAVTANSNLQGQITGNDTDITALQAEQTAQDTAIGVNASAAAANSSNIANNTTAIATNISGITTNSNNIATNVTAIAANTTKSNDNEADIIELTTNQVDLVSLTGVPENSADLGAFPGATITDNVDIKTALSELEGAVDSITGGATNITSVNGETGSSVTLTSDDIDDTADTNKWATQAELDQIGFNNTNIATNANDIASNDTDITNLQNGQTAQDVLIAANTAKVSADGSVATHSDVTSAGSGQIITATERNLLNSALQSETLTTLTESPADTWTYTSEDSTTTIIDITSKAEQTDLDAEETARIAGDAANLGLINSNTAAIGTKFNTADFEVTHDALPADNPHNVTATQVGLGNVDNTSDVNKPVSIAQQAALNLKQDLSEKAQANGYASLDANTKVPQLQLQQYCPGWFYDEGGPNTGVFGRSCQTITVTATTSYSQRNFTFLELVEHLITVTFEYSSNIISINFELDITIAGTPIRQFNIETKDQAGAGNNSGTDQLLVRTVQFPYTPTALTESIDIGFSVQTAGNIVTMYAATTKVERLPAAL